MQNDDDVRGNTSKEKAASLLWQGVDFRIPIWGVIGVAATIVGTLISNHFAQQQLTRDVAAVQAAILSGQQEAKEQFGKIAIQASSANVDVVELRIRLTNVEASLNRLYNLPAASATSKAEARATTR